MKIKYLLLGSVAAAGLSTSAYAADLGVVLTSMDLCDSLGVTGLAISADNNCAEMDQGVSYQLSLHAAGFGDVVVANDLVADAEAFDDIDMFDLEEIGVLAPDYTDPIDTGGIDEVVLVAYGEIIVPTGWVDDSASETLFGHELGLLPTTMTVGDAGDSWDPATMPVTNFGPAWHVVHGIAREPDGNVWGGSTIDITPAGFGGVLQVV